MTALGSRLDFGPVAGAYDCWYESWLGNAYDRLEKQAAVRALPSPRSEARLLDVGCGTGHWSAFFSERGFTVIGVDLSPEMIAVARGKEITNASFEVADAHALPFDDEAFAVTTAITTLEFVRDAEGVVKEMARCTEHSGGILLIGVLNALAPLNAKRKAAGKWPYKEARFFRPEEVERLLTPYGEPQVTVSAFVPRASVVRWLAPLTDLVGRRLHSSRGAFILGKVAL